MRTDPFKKFEKALKRARPMTGSLNDWQFEILLDLIPESLSNKECKKQIDRICDKIKYINEL